MAKVSIDWGGGLWVLGFFLTVVVVVVLLCCGVRGFNHIVDGGEALGELKTCKVNCFLVSLWERLFARGRWWGVRGKAQGWCPW